MLLADKHLIAPKILCADVCTQTHMHTCYSFMCIHVYIYGITLFYFSVFGLKIKHIG